MKIKRLYILSSLICLLFALGCSAKPFSKTKEYPAEFSDVSADAWYADSIKNVYETGLMDGVSDYEFDTESTMSVSQAITIAARLHSIYNDSQIPEIEGDKWYSKYVSYCTSNGIMQENQFTNYDAPIMSCDTITLFAAALPESYFGSINNVSDILDVPKDVYFAKDVFLFYNAGILCGNDDYGTFLPTSYLTRARAAAILSRIALPEMRLKFSLLEIPDEYDLGTVFDIFSYHTDKVALDKIILMSVDGFDISGAEYRYYSYANNGNAKRIEGNVKQKAILIRLSESFGLRIPREFLCKMLSDYYGAKTTKYTSGDYFSVLESNRLTDTVFANLTVTNQLLPLLLNCYLTTLTLNDVSSFSNSNGYIGVLHILVSKDTQNSQDIIKEVESKVLDGEDFSELIAQYGEDPGMEIRPSGYFFKKGTMVKAFEDAAFALNVDDVSNIVETEYGYHIIKRVEITPEALLNSPDFASIASDASISLFDRDVQALSNAFVIIYASNFDNLAAIID